MLSVNWGLEVEAIGIRIVFGLVFSMTDSIILIVNQETSQSNNWFMPAHPVTYTTCLSLLNASHFITSQHHDHNHSSRIAKTDKKNIRKALGLLPPGLEPETFALPNTRIEVLVRRSNQLSYGSR